MLQRQRHSEQNTVSSYSITKTDKIGTANEPKSDYDLIQVIMIRRGNENGSERIFDYLTGVFNGNQKKISDYVDIEDNAQLKEEIDEMSGMGMSIYRKAALEGIQKGRDEGVFSGMLTAVKNIMANMNVSAEQAMINLSIPESEREKYLAAL